MRLSQKEKKRRGEKRGEEEREGEGRGGEGRTGQNMKKFYQQRSKCTVTDLMMSICKETPLSCRLELYSFVNFYAWPTEKIDIMNPSDTEQQEAMLQPT